MKSKRIKEQDDTITAFTNILKDIMKESELTVRDLDRHCDLGIAKIKITVLEHVYHDDLVCKILQQAYDTTHIIKPWEPPTTDPEFNEIAHRQFRKIEDPGLEEYLRTKVLREKEEEEKNENI